MRESVKVTRRLEKYLTYGTKDTIYVSYPAGHTFIHTEVSL